MKNIEYILNDCLNKALCQKGRIQQPSSNTIAEFVSEYLKPKELTPSQSSRYDSLQIDEIAHRKLIRSLQGTVIELRRSLREQTITNKAHTEALASYDPAISKRFDSKYKPPFRVGRKQRKAVLDATGVEVVFFSDSEEQAKAYCEYLNK